MPNSSRRLLLLAPLALALALTACEQLGFEDPAKLVAVKEAEGRAVGSACRHSGRALEECYMLNPKAMKSAVFAGWRDMDGYMRENKIENVIPPDYRPKPPEEKAVESKPVEGKPTETKPGSEKAGEHKTAGKATKS